MDSGKRLATQEEKREYFETVLLADFLQGNHGLSRLLGRTIPVEMDEEDKQCLLDRLMKIPEVDKVMVYHTLNSLVVKSEEIDLVKEQIQLRDAKTTPTVKVMFKHLIPPTKKDGGWPCKHLNHPCLKEYYKLFNTYGHFMLAGSRNAQNVAFIWEHDMPFDIAIMRSPVGKKKVMRFVVFEAYPEVQIGCNMYISPAVQTPKKKEKETDVEMQ
jgi:hypothetical protein